MLVGERVGPFEIEREVGSGAMGTVYLAKYAKTGQRVALKMIAFGLIGNDTAMARFEREGEILRQLRHKNIVRLFATGRFRQTPFFAMEFVEGESLDRVQARRDRFTWEEVVQIGVQLCDALAHAHEKGIIHRDLKPSNLMVMADGTLKLTDFGIAKDMDVTALTGANSTIGTAAYMSPEQCRGEKDLSHKSDLYSLGVVMYELLTGRKPFTAESSVDMFMLHVNGKFERPSRLTMDIPVWLDTLVCQLLEKKPALRPLDSDMVKNVLLEVRDKAAKQQSAGRDAATDRGRFGDTFRDDEDRAAAKALRSGRRTKSKNRKPKRPKRPPFYRQVWFQAILILGFLSGVGYFLYMMSRPEPPESMLARLDELRMAHDEAGTRETLTPLISQAEAYLEIYGGRGDAAAERVRGLAARLRVEDRELAMYLRARRGLKVPQDGESEKAVEATFAAINAEKEGDLNEAAERWSAVRNEAGGEGAESAAWADLARERLRQITWTKSTAVEEFGQRYAQQKRGAVDPPPLPSDAARRAYRAFRYEWLAADYFRASEEWTALADDLEKTLPQRKWYLLARGRARSLEKDYGRKATENDVDARLERLTAVAVKARRGDRFLGEELADLYGDSENNAIRRLVKGFKGRAASD